MLKNVNINPISWKSTNKIQEKWIPITYMTAGLPLILFLFIALLGKATFGIYYILFPKIYYFRFQGEKVWYKNGVSPQIFTEGVLAEVKREFSVFERNFTKRRITIAKIERIKRIG